MGYYRFLLAAIVAYSHVPDRHLPLNLGVSAVVGFYFVSGYLMALSFRSFQAKSARPAIMFWADRLIRIMPTYWLVLSVTLVIVAINGRDWLNWSTLGEVLLLPYHVVYMFGSTNVLLPAWSLSAEMGFYLLVPALALLPTRALALLVIVLLAGQFVAFTIPGTITDLLFAGDKGACLAVTTKKFCGAEPADLLGYRWLPLTLVYFSFGMLVYRLQEQARWAMAAFVAANVAMLLLADKSGWLEHGYVDEELWGAIVLLPTALFAIASLKDLQDPLNVLLGKLSYPFFLTHWSARHIVGELDLGASEGLAMFALALPLAVATLLVQQHVERFRYRFRGFGKSTEALPPPAFSPQLPVPVAA